MPEQPLLQLRQLADPERAANLQHFFKTAPGDYGEGDRFLGIRVPELRKLAKGYRDLPQNGVVELLESEWHEARLLALLILVAQFDAGDEAAQESIFRLYLERSGRINNWDLVDLSAGHILGAWLFRRDRSPLFNLARSESLWERRMAVLACSRFIRESEFGTAFEIIEMLLNDPHDLIHKACGWMLREIGKRDPEAEEAFLGRHYRSMPRTMLRYAIERFPEAKRRDYLKGRV